MQLQHMNPQVSDAYLEKIDQLDQKLARADHVFAKIREWEHRQGQQDDSNRIEEMVSRTEMVVSNAERPVPMSQIEDNKSKMDYFNNQVKLIMEAQKRDIEWTEQVEREVTDVGKVSRVYIDKQFIDIKSRLQRCEDWLIELNMHVLNEA